MIFVRRVRADEWEALHDLRLRALTDAPEAFSTTLAEAERRSAAEWQAAAERGARGDRHCTFVADDANRLVGMVTVYLPEPAVPDAFPSLIRMWVDPAVRRSGVGTQLVRAVLVWATERGASAVRLQVNASDPRPIGFSEALGFRDTGRREPLLPERDVRAMEMEARPDA
ncbi:MAG TPA: GNAT family N-acetyltransferase [Candidatus Limnocylindria bacterium]|nr:GNAT family N-acetyltransferase [Candidatus Limnocylindria bacterium]